MSIKFGTPGLHESFRSNLTLFRIGCILHESQNNIDFLRNSYSTRMYNKNNIYFITV